jgi:hypothetical protein
MDIIAALKAELTVLSGAPMSLAVWSATIIGLTWWAATWFWHGRYEARLALADDRVRLYEAKLNVGSPDEAAAKLADLERQLGVERAARTGELTHHQVAAISQAARLFRGKILIAAPMGNHTSQELAQSLAEAFRSAGWDAVMSYDDNGNGLGVPRLYVIDRDNLLPVEQAAKTALDAAGIRVAPQTHYAPPADRGMWLKL